MTDLRRRLWVVTRDAPPQIVEAASELHEIPPIGYNRPGGRAARRERGDALQEYMRRIRLALRIRARWRVRRNLRLVLLVDNCAETTKSIRSWVKPRRRWPSPAALAIAALLGFCAFQMVLGWARLGAWWLR